MNPLEQLLLYAEMEEERKALKDLGLTDEDISGYFDFYVDSYVPEVDTQCKGADYVV